MNPDATVLSPPDRGETLVIEANPSARRRADLALAVVPIALSVAILLPRWWTITLAVVATLQVPAEWRWVKTARLTLDPRGIRWEAPIRGYDLAWDDVTSWQLRRIGIGGATSNEWLLTVRTSARRFPVRSFIWHDRTTMEELAPRVHAIHPLPDGWPAAD